MFKNRALQVKMVKNEKNKIVDPSDEDFTLEEKAAIWSQHLETVLDKAGGAMIAYLVLDTIRKVLVAKASK